MELIPGGIYKQFLPMYDGQSFTYFYTILKDENGLYYFHDLIDAATDEVGSTYEEMMGIMEECNTEGDLFEVSTMEEFLDFANSR